MRASYSSRSVVAHLPLPLLVLHAIDICSANTSASSHSNNLLPATTTFAERRRRALVLPFAWVGVAPDARWVDPHW